MYRTVYLCCLLGLYFVLCSGRPVLFLFLFKRPVLPVLISSSSPLRSSDSKHFAHTTLSLNPCFLFCFSPCLIILPWVKRASTASLSKLTGTLRNKPVSLLSSHVTATLSSPCPHPTPPHPDTCLFLLCSSSASPLSCVFYQSFIVQLVVYLYCLAASPPLSLIYLPRWALLSQRAGFRHCITAPPLVSAGSTAAVLQTTECSESQLCHCSFHDDEP